LTPPTLIIVGEVVKLHQKLAWFAPESDLHAGEPMGTTVNAQKK
jgi:uroporphyrin-III C-methyltransferase / precorrin-2 dehydrogenase / sirohydrochlorin ferrochelatase